MAYVNQKYQQLYSQKQGYFAPDVEAKAIPSPTGGWDAISPLSAMETKYAIILNNWVPRPGYVEIRGGYNAWTQGLASNGPIESLMAFRPAGSAQQLIAAGGGALYNVSDYGVSTTIVSGLSNSRWQYTNFTPSNGISYLLMVNGQDPYKLWNGTTLTEPSISGISSSTFINVNIFKRRVWFIPANSTIAYYLDTDAIAGTANPFPLGQLMNKGGYLMAMGTWTVDGGNGPDDNAIFITSQGQMIMYKGTDPANSNAWSLVGVFDLPIPLGRRCIVKIGSELAIITLQGLIPISQALPFDPAGVRSVALTNRIQNAMLQAAQLSMNMFGWEAKTFTQQTLLVMNVPQQENVTQVQYCMNMLTGAWCSFDSWNANSFEIFNESLYFGDNDGNVNLAYTSPLDLIDPIIADMKCAFNYFDDPGRQKNMSMLRPFLTSDGTIIPTLSVDVDFADSSVTAPVTIISPAGAVWDDPTSLWDIATWSTGAVIVNNWLSVNSLGTTLAIRMGVNVAGIVSGGSAAVDSVFDTGAFDIAIFDGSGSITASGKDLLTLRLNSFEALMEFGGPI